MNFWWCIFFSGMFSFLTAGSFVYVDIYGVSPDMFGYLFGLNILAMMAMTSVNSRFVKRVGSHFMLRFGLFVQLLAGAGLLAGWVFDWGLWGTVIFVVLYIGTISTIGSNSMGLLMSHYPENGWNCFFTGWDRSFWDWCDYWCDCCCNAERRIMANGVQYGYLCRYFCTLFIGC
ncbi:hypothetical protein P4S72_24695 [Vibrio sp. PP-XX7]